MKLSDELEARIAKIAWVEPHVTHYSRTPSDSEHVRTNDTEGNLRYFATREAHAECEALREQIREVVRQSVAEAFESLAAEAERHPGILTGPMFAAVVRHRARSAK